MSVQHIWNLSQLLGRDCLLAVNVQISLETSSLKCANNVPKLPGLDYVAKKLGTSHDVKGFAIGSFLERIIVEIVNDDLRGGWQRGLEPSLHGRPS